jgi:spore maturation protein CgeE
MSDNKMIELIRHEISLRIADNQNFCKISLGFQLSPPFSSMFTPNPAVDRLGFYSLCKASYSDLKGNNDCSIMRIDNPKAAEDNVYYDLLLDKDRLGEDFCRRRAITRGNVYLNDCGVDAFICYHDGVPVGTCELFLHNNVAKIENFTVLPREQRKGYGTSILKHLINLALEKKAQTIYLVTDEDDTAKDMYRKFGFEKTDETTDMFFAL